MFAKAQPKPNCCQTYVVKAECDAQGKHERVRVLKTFADGELTRGAGVWAIVEKGGAAYLVITFAEECDFKCRARRIQELLTKIPLPQQVIEGGPPGNFAVTIEKFTRPWQRFLGWGDVHATADVVASADEGRGAREGGLGCDWGLA